MSDPNVELAALFGWAEYLVFASLLGISVGIGIYYGFFGGGKQKTTAEFLMANRSMSLFPMSMSVIASFISAITLLGIPVEMYNYGTQYYLVVINFFFVTLASAYLYLPVFFNLQVTSTYEYLELRFNKTARRLGSAIFILQMTIYIAIVVLAPALALSQVTGMPDFAAVIAIFVVVVFYTAIGGMKAVMWTDTFQVFIMYGALLIVIFKGCYDLGGPGVVWEIAEKGGRIEFFNFSFDPRVRHTVWGIVIGGYFTWATIYGTNQAQVQRYLTVPTKGKAIAAIWINFVGITTMVSLCCFGGLVIYAKYAGCHPLYAGRAKKADQLFPLFVMETLGEFKGLPGLFVAGVFSGALSTVSSGLNSLAAITLEDFVKGIFFPDISDSKATLWSKILSVAYGVVSFGMVLLARNLGSILTAAISIFGMTGGPLLGIFTLGIFFPQANARGAVIGTLVSLAFISWLGFGAQIAAANGDLVIPKLNFSIEECPVNATITIPPVNIGKEGGLLEFYRISYMWYSAISCLTTVFVGLIISFFGDFKKNARELNPKYISPPLHTLYNKIMSREMREKLGFEIGTHFVEEKGVDNPGFHNDGESRFNRDRVPVEKIEMRMPNTINKYI